MRKKLILTSCLTITGIIIIASIMLIISFHRLSPEYYGLNYNSITANYSDNTVYEAGLYALGVSNYFLQIDKIPQTIIYDDITTYTSDYYPLKVSVSITYSLNLPTENQFNFLSEYYKNFGEDPEVILSPLFKNQILIAVSSENSLYYQTGLNVNTDLEQYLKNKIQLVISTWTSMNITVLIQSIVCGGISKNTESIDSKINSLQAKSERVQMQKVQLTNYTNSILNKFLSDCSFILTEIKARASQIQYLLTSNAANQTSKVAFGEQIMRRNASFASSELLLRPQLYIITNQTTSF